MNRTSRIIFGAAFVLLASASCTDLTTLPKSTIGSSTAFSDTASYKAFIAKIYGGLQLTGQQGPAGLPDLTTPDEGFSQYIRLLWQMQELPTDETAIAWNDQGVQELNTQLWSSSNQFLVSMYYRVFFQVALVNEFLRQTTDAQLAARNVSPALTATIKQYRAEARFLRALSYWHGIDLFGNIPLVKEDFPLGTTPPTQATRGEIYDYIVSELLAIQSDLPAAHAGEYGRADQGAVAMLLAKLYLNAQVYTGSEHYAEVITALAPVLAPSVYTLDASYQHLFLADNNTSPELIFVVPFDGKHTQSYGGTTFLTHAETGNGIAPAVVGIDGGWYGLRVRKEVSLLYPSVPGPDHRADYFYTAGQDISMSNLTDFGKGYLTSKYRNVKSDGSPGQIPGFSDVDYPMFRLGDAYLMYAEAVLRGGGGTRAQALLYVNALRERAYGNASGDITDTQLTLPFLRDERSRELLWEGHRRTDLIRFASFTEGGVWQWKGNVLAGTVTETFRNLYPLPASEVIANHNLTQNSGY
ncbi:MAG: RagB/SusD protein [Gemmatimonadetes bacterium]|nr:RagB/SusD protein [Gemmatimonadota bacterium]